MENENLKREDIEKDLPDLKEKDLQPIPTIREMDNKQNETPVMNVNIEALISHAINKQTPIEVMRGLLDMRRELKEEAAQNAYFQALANFQMECPIIEKKIPVCDKSGKLRYRYASIDDIIKQVKPYLSKYGFSYVIKTKHMNKGVIARCNVFHKAGHKEVDEDGVFIPIDPNAYMNEGQKRGNAMSYARRYSFCNAFGIITGDGDDDNNYTGEPETKQSPKKENPRMTYNNAPKKNKEMYSSIMALIREKYKNTDLFTPAERAENKKKADAIIRDVDALMTLCKGINNIAKERKQTIEEAL